MSKRERYDDISDDEIRIIGHSDEPRNTKRVAFIALAVVAIVCAALALIFVGDNDAPAPETEQQIPIYGEEPMVVEEAEVFNTTRLSRVEAADTERGFVELRDTTINDVPLRIYIPHNAELTLHVGRVDREDRDIVYTAEAAFIRADNHAILGAFVLKGEPRAWGLSMRGYCASIDGEVTIGVADN